MMKEWDGPTLPDHTSHMPAEDNPHTYQYITRQRSMQDRPTRQPRG